MMREEKIIAHRRSQPVEVLREKARKSRNRAKLWTQEQIDAGIVEGQLLYKWLQDNQADS